MNQDRRMLVRLSDHGSKMGKYNNTCFFNSLNAELIRLGIDAPSTYELFLALGGFPKSTANQMIDTVSHRKYITNLATNLGITIAVFGNLMDVRTSLGIINPELATLFGTDRRKIAFITKIENGLHYKQILVERQHMKIYREVFEQMDMYKNANVEKHLALISKAPW